MKKLLIVIAIMAISAGLFAQGYMGGMKKGNHNKGMRIMKVLNELELTKSQEEQIGALKVKHQKTMIDLTATLQKLRLDKQTAMHKQNFSEAEKAIKKLTKAKEAIALKRLAMHKSVYKILDDTQKDKLKEIMAKKPMQKRENKMHHQRNGKMKKGMKQRNCD